MIIGVDIGGTKTLVACFAENGKMLKEVRFETNTDYGKFLEDLERYARDIETGKAKVGCVAVPGEIDRANGKIVALGNLPWKGVNIVADSSRALSIKNVQIENDANLAALAEARALPQRENLVLYITLSTGIGSGIIVNNRLLPELSGSEAGQMMIHDANGLVHRWETFASGRALVKLTGKRAEDLEESMQWKEYTEKVCLGLQPTISVLRPNKVVIGGGVGAHLDKFLTELNNQLEKLNHSRSYTTPEILKAHYGEESVIYGCYEYAKDQLAQH